MNFRVGEKVICTFSGWKNRNGVRRFVCPVKDQEYVVAGIAYWTNGHECLILEGFPPENGYSSRHFRKLHDDTVDRILKAITSDPFPVK